MASRNPLSCLRCKKRKIRCDRLEPQCDRCREARSSCEYVPRRARTKKSSSQEKSPGSDVVQMPQNILADILARLSRLEQLEKRRYGDSSILSDVDPSEASPASSNDGQGAQQEPSASLSRLVAEATALAQCSLQEHDHSPRSPDNLLRILKSLESISLTNTPNKALSPNSNVPEPDGIPRELSVRWTRIFYTSFNTVCTLVPMKEEYVLSIPDLMKLPHVSVDIAALVIWYNVMFHGLHADPESISHRATYSSYLYRKCLQVSEKWSDKAGMTVLDLEASMLMSWLSCEKLDVNNAYRFHTQACRLARELGYVAIDASDDPGKVLTAKEEEEINNRRFSFWQLQAFDTVLRLHFSKPCQIKPGSWQVKFPELKPTTPHDREHSLQVNFMVAMRLTLISRQYFDYKDGLRENDINTLEQFNVFIDSLIAEIETLLADWDIEHRLATANSPLEAWLFADIIFNGKTTVIHFAREKCERNREFTVPPESIGAARSLIASVQRMCAAHPISANYSMNFISLYPIVSVVTLYANALQTTDLVEAESDVALLEWLGATLQAWVKEREELQSVTDFVNALNGVCRQVLTLKIRAATGKQREREANNAAAAAAAAASWNVAGASISAGASAGSSTAAVSPTDPFWQLGSSDLELTNLMQDPVQYMRQLEAEILKSDTDQNWWPRDWN